VAVDRILTWKGRGVELFAAFDAKAYAWRFRARKGGKVSPVFGDEDGLLTWMQLEEWTDG
jgi:hypothetical protein